MANIEKPTSKFYTYAEVVGQDHPSVNGETERLVRIRFITIDVSDTGQSEGSTEWVTFTLEGLERLSSQLAAAVETVRHWTPGQQPETVGANLGLMAHDVRI